MSVVETVLANFGFEWRTNPYRITDKNGATIQAGPHFDVRSSALLAQSKAAQRRANSCFKAS